MLEGSPSSWRHLSSLSQLTSLALVLDPRDPGVQQLPAVAAAAPQLQEVNLNVWGGPDDDLTALSNLQLRRLHVVKYGIFHPATGITRRIQPLG